MTIKGKVVATLIVVIAIYTMFSYLAFNHWVYPEFSDLEERAAVTNLQRVEEALKSELEHLNTTNRVWAYSDDTYRFAQTGDLTYIEANPEMASLASLNLNTILFYNAMGELIWGKVIDLTREEVLPIETLFSQPLAADSDLLRHDPQQPKQSGYTGLVPTSYGPMLISSLAILTSTYTEPPAGTIIIGRFLNAAMIETYRARTKVDFQLTPVSDDEASAAVAGQFVYHKFVHHNRPQALPTSTVLNDIYGAPYLHLRISTLRDITTTGGFVLQTALLTLLLAGLINLVVIWLLLKQFIITPLGQLKNRILAICTHGLEDTTTLAATSGPQRRDEIGVLSKQFDDLVRKLAAARRQLIDQSFKAGMAETAAGILHNLRNALMLLTHQIDEMRAVCLEAPGTHLEQAIDQLTVPQVAAERRAKLVDYVKLSARQLIEMRTEFAEQLNAASQQIDHIEAILSDQEQLSEAEPVIEALCLTNVVSEAMGVLPANNLVQVDVTLDDTLTAVGPVDAHKLGLVQVFSKLLLNASESIQRTGQAAGRIALQAVRQKLDNQIMIQVQVFDNGEGIDPAMLTSIFQRDYSSKGSAKDGLSLHWCANAITSMGGVLQARSDGLGCGAQFSVLLPATETS